MIEELTASTDGKQVDRGNRSMVGKVGASLSVPQVAARILKHRRAQIARVDVVEFELKPVGHALVDFEEKRIKVAGFNGVQPIGDAGVLRIATGNFNSFLFKVD